jgi:hypothetical protein
VEELRWKPIPGYPGYEVSETGLVRTWRKRNARARPPAEPRIVQWVVGDNGRAQVSLSLDGKVKNRQVHQLVLEAFVGPRPEGCVGRHVVDNNPLNNCLSNLAWGTPKQNQEDRLVHGTDLRGAQVYNAKLDDKRAEQVYLAPGKHRDIAQAYGIDRTLVGKIKTGKAWAHIAVRLRGQEAENV